MKHFNYKIDVKNSLNELDKQVIIHLYQPILGLETCSIFFTLVEEGKLMAKLPNSVFTFKRLEQLFNLEADKIKTNLRKLEGMNLIKTFKSSSSNEIIYKIQQPLKPLDFFENVLFDDALKIKLEPLCYEMIRVFYLGEDGALETEEAQDVSCNFQEAFPDAFNDIRNNNHVIQQELISPDCINFDSIEQFMVANSMNVASLNNKLRKTIASNLSTNEVCEQDIKLIIKQSYDFEKEEINKDSFKVLLKNIAIEKQVKQVKSKNDLKIQEMEEHDPEDYVEQLFEQAPERTVLNIINNLKSKYLLNAGVINCLLDFCYWQNNKKIVGNYLYKIAGTLKDKGICATAEVMNYLKNAAKHKTGRKLSTQIKTKQLVKRTKEMVPSLIESVKEREEKSEKSLQWLKEQMSSGFSDENDANKLVPFTEINKF